MIHTIDVIWVTVWIAPIRRLLIFRNILRKHLLKCFDENDIFEIEYQSWFQTDRCTIPSKTINVHEFIDTGGEINEIKNSRFFC